MQRGTVIVGLSGGVDSAVAALLLQREGYAVQGLFMQNWSDDDGYCSAAQDLQDAAAVCAELDIPLHRADFSREYRQRVFDLFLEEYAAGRTPNPDVLCNSEIKFAAFLDHALRLGADRIATGHYACVEGDPARLLIPADADKDQTYFLHRVRREALARTLMPLAGLRKDEVRRLARDAGFDNFDKKDSTGICFIGERPFREFLAGFLPARPGEIRDTEGRVLGEHQGALYYTIGQRRGLGIGGVDGREEEAWYVVDKDVERNLVIVAQGHDHPLLMDAGLQAERASWIGAAPEPGETLLARTRHRQALQPCVLEQREGERFSLRFERPQRAVTPGQYAVLYRDRECLGGGVIAARGIERRAA